MDFILHTLDRHKEAPQRPSSTAVADPGFSPGGGGAPTSKIAIIFHIFAENCVKMKEFGPPGGVPGAPLGSANVLGRSKETSVHIFNLALFYIQMATGLALQIHVIYVCCM